MGKSSGSKKFPYPYKHLRMEAGGHLTVHPGASPKLIAALLEMVRLVKSRLPS